MYEKHAPKQGDAFPLTGCVFGCIVSNGWYTDLQEKFGAAFGWSGKCFSEELRADGTPLHFGSTLQARALCVLCALCALRRFAGPRPPRPPPLSGRPPSMDQPQPRRPALGPASSNIPF